MENYKKINDEINKQLFGKEGEQKKIYLNKYIEDSCFYSAKTRFCEIKMGDYFLIKSSHILYEAITNAKINNVLKNNHLRKEWTVYCLKLTDDRKIDKKNVYAVVRKRNFRVDKLGGTLMTPYESYQYMSESVVEFEGASTTSEVVKELKNH